MYDGPEEMSKAVHYISVKMCSIISSAGRLLKSEPRVPSWVTSCEICGGLSAIGTGSHIFFGFSPAIHHSTIAPYSFINVP